VRLQVLSAGSVADSILAPASGMHGGDDDVDDDAAATGDDVGDDDGADGDYGRDVMMIFSHSRRSPHSMRACLLAGWLSTAQRARRTCSLNV
jgi:hypothetical protein